MLQRCIILPLLILSTFAGIASDKKPVIDSTTVIIKLAIVPDEKIPIDSVFLVFDRYDRRGAGVVRQIFYPVDNTVKIIVPKGKYYVNIVCLGNCNHEYFDRIVNAKANKENTLFVKLQESALFIPGFASIPEEKIDLSNLSITRDDWFK